MSCIEYSNDAILRYILFLLIVLGVVDTPFTLSGTSPSLLRAHASETYPMPTLPTIPQISPVCNHPATLTRAPVNLTLAPTTPQNYNPHIPDIL